MSPETSEVETIPRIALTARVALAPERPHMPDATPRRQVSSQALIALVVGCLTLGGFASPASAQTIPFDDLARTLEIGQEIRVKTSDGNRTRGKIVAIGENGILIARRRFPRRRIDVAFAKDAVRGIDVVDSVWAPGGYIGAAAGIGMVAAYLKPSSISGDELYYVGLMAGAVVPVSVAVGMLVDGLINKSYVVGTPTPQVTVAPLLARDRKGIAVALRF